MWRHTIYDRANVGRSWPYLQDDPSTYKAFLENYYYFVIEGYERPFGYVHLTTVRSLSWTSAWDVDHDRRFVTLQGAQTFEERTEIMHEVLWHGHLNKASRSLLTWKGRLCPVETPSGEHVLNMEESGADIMGILSYGIHLVAWTRKGNEKLFWVQRRSMDKPVQPGKLDVALGGTLHPHQRPLDNMIERGHAEANLSESYLRERLESCGTISYTMARTNQGEPGCQQHTQYLYEMEVGEDVQLVPMEGETDKFELISLSGVLRALDEGDFKWVASLVWVNYFIRHGILHPGNEPNLAEIDNRLHRKHDFFVV